MSVQSLSQLVPVDKEEELDVEDESLSPSLPLLLESEP